MSTPATCAASRNATSLQGSEFGRLPFGAPAGQTIDLFGPVPVPANLSARQAKDLGLLMSGTSGQPGTTSSHSESLQNSLESKFLTRLKRDGLISSETTWKHRIMPSGRFVSVLTRRGGQSKGSVSTLLPSISAREWRDRSQALILARLDRGDGVAKRICSLSPALRLSQEIVGLNPCFGLWLMGLPQTWAHCMPLETPSTLKRRRNS